MCTVTWLQHDNGYEVFCNRDELRTRKPALPPRLSERNGVRYLAPVDADAGGAWIGVNELGLTLCLVNHYPALAIPPLRGARRVSPVASTEKNTPLKEGITERGGIIKNDYRSRGLLLTELLDCATPEMIAARLEREAMIQYRSFILLAFALQSPARMFVWNEANMHAQLLLANDLPVTSSSYQTEAVIAARRRWFAECFHAEQEKSSEQLMNFHRSHTPERSAYSVCMHREDAETVSYTRVRVRHEFAELFYLPHSPCVDLTGQRFHLQFEEVPVCAKRSPL